MAQDLTNRCWKALLLLTRTLQAHTGPVEFCSIQLGKVPRVKINDVLPSSRDAHAILISLNSEPKIGGEGGSLFTVTNMIEVTRLRGNGVSRKGAKLLSTYLPYCLFPVYAHRFKRAIAVSHFAQSLDGRIATESGDSKWIGDEDNRTHAHHMRALCQGVLIGSGTLKRDRPALTVRKVEGPNPRPVLVGSSVKKLEDLARTWGPSLVTFASGDGPVSPLNILESLYNKGILSVYIEGGSETTSRFLNEDAVDIVQIHISPMIMGSGIPSFSLPPIESVGEARRFQIVRYVPVGDGIMFVGVPASTERRLGGE